MISRSVTGPSWTPVSFVRRWTGSAWVDVSFVRRWDGTAWVQVWPVTSTLTASANLSEAVGGFTCTYNGIGINTCPVLATVVSPTVTITSSGGSGAGPTFAWAYLMGDTGISISDPTASSVTFSAPVNRRGTRTAVWRCTVTRGADTAIVDVNVVLYYDYSANGEVIP